MAKSLSCKDVGMVGCEFTAKAETMEELLQAAASHAKEAHGLDSIPPDLLPMVHAAVRDESPGRRLQNPEAAKPTPGDAGVGLIRGSVVSFRCDFGRDNRLGTLHNERDPPVAAQSAPTQIPRAPLRSASCNHNKRRSA